MLGDAATAGKILDRFMHHAQVVQLQGRCYRMHCRGDSQTTDPEPTLTPEVNDLFCAPHRPLLTRPPMAALTCPVTPSSL